MPAGKQRSRFGGGGGGSSARPQSAEQALLPVGGKIERLPPERHHRPHSTPSGVGSSRLASDSDDGGGADEAGTFITSLAGGGSTSGSQSASARSSTLLPATIRDASPSSSSSLSSSSSGGVDAETARRRALLMGPSRSEQARADLRAHLTSLTERKDSEGNKLVSFPDKFIRQVKSASPTAAEGGGAGSSSSTAAAAAAAGDEDGDDDSYSLASGDDDHYDDDDEGSDYSYTDEDSGGGATDEEIEDEPDVAHIPSVLPKQQGRKKKKNNKKKKRHRRKRREHKDASAVASDGSDRAARPAAAAAGTKASRTEEAIRAALVASPLHFIEEVEAGNGDEDAGATLLARQRPPSAVLVAQVVGAAEDGIDGGGGDGVQELRHWQAAVAAQNERRAELMGPSKSDRARAELRAHLASLTQKVAFSEDFVAEVKASGDAARSRDERAQQLLEEDDDGGEDVLYEDRSDAEEEGAEDGEAKRGGGALLGKRPTHPRWREAGAGAGSDGGNQGALTFDPDDFDVVRELGLGADDDDSALSKEERVRLARLLASPGKGAAGHDSFDPESEEAKIRSVRAAQQRLKEIDAKLRALQMPRLAHNAMTMQQQQQQPPDGQQQQQQQQQETTDAGGAGKDRPRTGKTYGGVQPYGLRTSGNLRLLSGVGEAATADEEGDSPAPSPRSQAGTPRGSGGAGGNAEPTAAETLAARTAKRVRRERLKDIDKQLARLRAGAQRPAEEAVLLPRSEVDRLAKDMGEEFMAASVPVAPRGAIQNLLQQLLNPLAASPASAGSAGAASPSRGVAASPSSKRFVGQRQAAAQAVGQKQPPRLLQTLCVAEVVALVSALPETRVFAPEMERHHVDGKAICRLTMRDLTAMEVGTVAQRRALIKRVTHTKRNGVLAADLLLRGAPANGTGGSVAAAAAATAAAAAAAGGGAGGRSSARGPVSLAADKRGNAAESPATLGSPGRQRSGGRGVADRGSSCGDRTAGSASASTPPAGRGVSGGGGEPVTLRETVSQLRNRGRRAASGLLVGPKAAEAAKKAALARASPTKPTFQQQQQQQQQQRRRHGFASASSTTVSSSVVGAAAAKGRAGGRGSGGGRNGGGRGGGGGGGGGLAGEGGTRKKKKKQLGSGFRARQAASKQP